MTDRSYLTLPKHFFFVSGCFLTKTAGRKAKKKLRMTSTKESTLPEVSVLTGVVPDVTAVFSDIDGTIAHYAKTLVKLGYVRLEGVSESWRYDDERYVDELERLLWTCYPQSYRDKRFATIPSQYWQHVDSQRVVKTYELYNLSLTGAVISENTILLMELMQCAAFLYRGLAASTIATPAEAVVRKPVVCCLITGARTSTFARRRHGGSLPQTSFESCEGGSKLWCRLSDPLSWFKDGAANAADGGDAGLFHFYPCQSADVVMDDEWTNQFCKVTGFCVGLSEKESRSLQTSRPAMWELEALLNGAGFTTDHKDYDTSFLIDIGNSPCVRSSPSHVSADAPNYPVLFDSTADAEKYVVSKFKDSYGEVFGVDLFVNLGKGQVNARGSGKRGVMLHVLDKAAKLDFEANHTDVSKRRYDVGHTVALFDDENDLQFAELCAAGILPSVAHDEVLAHQEWRCHPSERKWFRAPVEGLLGSEWALKQIILSNDTEHVLSSVTFLFPARSTPVVLSPSLCSFTMQLKGCKCEVSSHAKSRSEKIYNYGSHCRCGRNAKTAHF